MKNNPSRPNPGRREKNKLFPGEEKKISYIFFVVPQKVLWRP